MSMEVHKYIETALEKKESLFHAQVLDFPKDKKLNTSKEFKLQILRTWELNDKSNSDQLRAVTGICFMFVALIVMGIYSNLL